MSSEVKDFLEKLASRKNYQNSSYIKRCCFKYNLLQEKCYACGIGPTWNGKPLTLQLDHIDGNRYNNDLDNLQILCPNCHSQTPTFASKRTREHSYVEVKRCVLCHNKLKDKRNTRCHSCHLSSLRTTQKAIKQAGCISCGQEAFRLQRCRSCYAKHRDVKKKPLSKCRICDKALFNSKSRKCKPCYLVSEGYVGTLGNTKIDWPDDSTLINEIRNASSMEALSGRLGVSSNAIRKRCKKRNIDYTKLRPLRKKRRQGE